MATKLTDKASIEQILKEMTVEEKALIITGGSSFGGPGNEKYGIPRTMLIDAGTGVNMRQYLANLLNTGVLKAKNGNAGGMGNLSELVYVLDNMENPEELTEDEKDILDTLNKYIEKQIGRVEYPSSFPCNSLVASTWNPDVAYTQGCAVGKEANAYGVDMLLGTTAINIQRDPRGGRGFEYYSEDPYLTAEMAWQYPKGVQEQNVIADTKHFAINSQETNRQTINELVSERAIREIYLPGFKACVQRGKVRNIMTSYNWINGVAAAHNKWLIQDVLRGEWGFDGFVVSDWGGVYDQVAAVEAGNDLCMPGPRPVDSIVKAVEEGRLSMEKLDSCVRNFLTVVLDMPVMKGRTYTDIDTENSKKVAYNGAKEGIILLKNNGVLPLSTDTKTAFFGRRSHRFEEAGVGSGRVFTNKHSSLIDTAREISGEENVLDGVLAAETEVAVYSLFSAGQEGGDRANLNANPDEYAEYMEMAKAAKAQGKKVVLVLNIAGPLELTEMEKYADAIILVYFPGQEGAHVTGDILFGKVNPSGKLAQTFPKHLYDVPAYDNFPGENEVVNYGEGIFVGYRYYDRHHVEPMYPFGHGLSYTTFEISEPEAASEFNFDAEDSFEIKVKVTNTGSMAGAEVVQLYLQDVQSVLLKPTRELKAFKKVYLEPGESKIVTLTLTKESLSSYDERLKAWAAEPGDFVAHIGNSSRNLPVKVKFHASGKNPYAYGAETEYVTIARDARLLKILLDVVPETVLTEGQVKRQTFYVAFRFTLAEAYDKYVRPQLPADEAEKIWQELLRRLGEVDVAQGVYKEDEVF